jgi:Flagellar regulator YcgR
MPDIASRLSNTGQLLVRSGIEIDRLLRAMVDERTAVQASLRDVMFLSRVVAADADEQQLMLAYSEHKPANAAVLALPAVTLKCNHHGAQFAFSCTKPRQAMHSGHPAIRMTAPAIVLAQEQRRPLTRPKHVPAEADVTCELRLGLQAFGAKLVDVGLDGAAYMLCDPAIPVCAGTRLQGARIRAAGTEPVVVDVDVSKVDHAKLPDGKRATRIGCRIAAGREDIEKLIRLFIIDLQ